MGEAGYTQLLDLACGGFLLTAVLVLWRRELPAINRLLVLQGISLAAIAAVRAAQTSSVALAGLAAGILVVRAALLPYLMQRTLGEVTRENRPVSAWLLAAAGLTLLGYAVAQPLIRAVPSVAANAVPIGIAVLLIGFLVLVTRRGAVSAAAGFLLMDNGITAVAVLTTTAVPLVAGLGVALDGMFAMLVLQILTADTDPDELRELRN